MERLVNWQQSYCHLKIFFWGLNNHSLITPGLNTKKSLNKHGLTQIDVRGKCTSDKIKSSTVCEACIITGLSTINYKTPPSIHVMSSLTWNPLSETPNQTVLAPLFFVLRQRSLNTFIIVNPFQKLSKEYFHIKN